ncbi:MAG: hypothetical protein COA69_02935 [Robiginitomaculum sp.]|nr:MAG: hypothetical protein COA69_02935 [Robiginitomaculum sp.]
MFKKTTITILAVSVLTGCATIDRSDSDTGKSLATAVTSPLDVLNIRKQEAPLYLQQGGYIYQASPRPSCRGIAQELSALNEAIGETDADDEAAKQTEGQQRADTTTDVVSSASASIIPFSGVVRVVSGAKAAQKKFDAYYDQGRRRRAFLKGYALGIGCPSPISPKVLMVPTGTK